MDKSTPRPWVRDAGSPTISHGILIDGPRPNKDAIVEVHCDPEDNLSREEAEANADLILRAVNSHDALVEACERALEAVEDHKGLTDSCAICRGSAGEMREALKLAKGEGDG